MECIEFFGRNVLYLPNKRQDIISIAFWRFNCLSSSRFRVTTLAIQ